MSSATPPAYSLKPLLAEHPFFKGMEDEYIELLSECASNVRYSAGDPIVSEGEAANRMFLIRYGKVALQIHSPNHGPIIIQTLDPGEVLGWSWMMPPYKWHFDAVAVDETRAISLDGECLRKKCANDPKLGYELMSRVAELVVERLNSTRLQLIQAYEEMMP
jgi:CRP/FNR family transcriptional regulator, cyclic AMP receptor protein